MEHIEAACRSENERLGGWLFSSRTSKGMHGVSVLKWEVLRKQKSADWNSGIMLAVSTATAVSLAIIVTTGSERCLEGVCIRAAP